jgi:integrase
MVPTALVPSPLPRAGVAQLAERQPSKLHVASSNLVSRSNTPFVRDASAEISKDPHLQSRARDTAILRLLMDTGMRLGELSAMQLDDVDLDQRMPAVRHGETLEAWFGDTYCDVHNLTSWPAVVVRAGWSPEGSRSASSSSGRRGARTWCWPRRASSRRPRAGGRRRRCSASRPPFDWPSGHLDTDVVSTSTSAAASLTRSLRPRKECRSGERARPGERSPPRRRL